MLYFFSRLKVYLLSVPYISLKVIQSLLFSILVVWLSGLSADLHSFLPGNSHSEVIDRIARNDKERLQLE